MPGMFRDDCYNTCIRRASRRFAELYDAALEPAGVNAAQFSLLRAIAADEPVSLSDLAERVALDRSTIGRNVRVLGRSGHVVLTRGVDHRETRISLTPEGEAALSMGEDGWATAQQAISTRLGSEAVAMLRTALEKL